MKLIKKYDIGNKVLNRSTYIYNINQWARQNPQRAFDDDFAALRLYLTDETWRMLLDLNPDIKIGDRKYNVLPNQYKAEFAKHSVTSAIDKKGAPIAGGLMLAATAPLWWPYANRMWLISKWGSKAPGIWGRMPSLAAVESNVSRPWLTPALGKLADATVAGYFGYSGASGMADQYKEGTLNFDDLENTTNTVLNGLSILPAIAEIPRVPGLIRSLKPTRLKKELYRQFSRIFPNRRLRKLKEQVKQNYEDAYNVRRGKFIQYLQSVVNNNLDKFENLGTAIELPPYGDFEWPLYRTGDIIRGNIPEDYLKVVQTSSPKVFEEPRWKSIRVGIGTNELVRSSNAGNIEALRLVLLDNIAYLEKFIPGSKVYGSSKGVANGSINLIPKDMEVMISAEDFAAFKAAHPEANIGYINEYGTAKYYMNNSWKDHGIIDLNIVEVDKQGYGNKRAMSIYLLYFPREYHNTVRLISEGKLTPSKYDKFPILDMNGNPISAKLLVQAYNPEESTILDSFLANFTIGRKAKHKIRSIEYLAGDRPDLVHKVLQRYADMLTGGRGRLLPNLTFGTELENQALLKSIGFKGDINTVAKDPAKMQNALNAWYLTESGMAGRAALPGDIGEGDIADWAKTLRNFSKWLYTGEGGTDSGFGLNWTAGADSQASRQLKGYVLPYVKGLFNGMKAEDAVNTLKRVMLHPDYKLTQEEANLINEVYDKFGVRHTRPFRAGDNGLFILLSTEHQGKHVYNANKEIALRLGLNFATGIPYNFHGPLQPYYVGSMRDFNYTPEGGDILGVTRFDGEGAFESMPSWIDRFGIAKQKEFPFYEFGTDPQIKKYEKTLTNITKKGWEREGNLRNKLYKVEDKELLAVAVGVGGTPLTMLGALIATAVNNRDTSFFDDRAFYKTAKDLVGYFGKPVYGRKNLFLYITNMSRYNKLPYWLREELKTRYKLIIDENAEHLDEINKQFKRQFPEIRREDFMELND